MAAALGSTCTLRIRTLRVNNLSLKLAALDRLLPYPRAISPLSQQSAPRQHTSSVTMQVRFHGVMILLHISLRRDTSTTTAHPCSRKALKLIMMCVLADRTSASPLQAVQARNPNTCGRRRFSHGHHQEVRHREVRHMAERHTYLVPLARPLYKCTSVRQPDQKYLPKQKYQS